LEKDKKGWGPLPIESPKKRLTGEGAGQKPGGKLGKGGGKKIHVKKSSETPT